MVGGKNSQVQTQIQFAAVFMDICKYWYTGDVKGPVKLPLNTMDEEEFESLTKIILEVTYLDLIRSALKL